MTSSENSPETPQNPYAPTAWGSYDDELVCPSGQKCRVKKLDFTDVMASGMMDQLNTLSGVVDKHAKKADGQPPIDAYKMMTDKRTAGQMKTLIDEVVCMVVTAPMVEMPPEDFTKRVVGVVYSDTIGILDKMRIFEVAMGDLSELEKFRSGTDKSA